MPGVLEGIKVLDFTRVIAGTFCTMYMADLGAEVIKVELPGTGEVMRVQPPVKNGESGFYITLNRGKKSISLNLKNEKARAELAELVKNRLLEEVFNRLIDSGDFDKAVESVAAGEVDPYTACDDLLLSRIELIK